LVLLAGNQPHHRLQVLQTLSHLLLLCYRYCCTRLRLQYLRCLLLQETAHRRSGQALTDRLEHLLTLAVDVAAAQAAAATAAAQAAAAAGSSPLLALPPARLPASRADVAAVSQS
jgi:hypothetical protein